MFAHQTIICDIRPGLDLEECQEPSMQTRIRGVNVSMDLRRAKVAALLVTSP